MSLLDTLAFYFAYPFVRYALIVGVLIALCSSLLGVTLVLKRFSFIGDGLSHVAVGAIAIAAVLNLSNQMILHRTHPRVPPDSFRHSSVSFLWTCRVP